MSRWANLSLILLRERTYRFSELRRRTGNVSENMWISGSVKKVHAARAKKRAVNA